MRGLTVCLLLSLSLVGCDDRSYREIGAAIDVLATRSEELPGPAIARANQEGINLFSTPRQTFYVVGKLWDLGLRGE